MEIRGGVRVDLGCCCSLGRLVRFGRIGDQSKENKSLRLPFLETGVDGLAAGSTGAASMRAMRSDGRRCAVPVASGFSGGRNMQSGENSSNRLERSCISLSVLSLTYPELSTTGDPLAAKNSTHLLFSNLFDGNSAHCTALSTSSLLLLTLTRRRGVGGGQGKFGCNFPTCRNWSQSTRNLSLSLALCRLVHSA